MEPEQVPPAAWYPDPWATATWRYWDGREWTAHTSEGAPQTESPLERLPRTWRKAVGRALLGDETVVGLWLGMQRMGGLICTDRRAVIVKRDREMSLGVHAFWFEHITSIHLQQGSLVPLLPYTTELQISVAGVSAPSGSGYGGLLVKSERSFAPNTVQFGRGKAQRKAAEDAHQTLQRLVARARAERG